MSNYERFIDRLFDENNEEKITLDDKNGKKIEFEQVAVVDYNENYYSILCPITEVEGVGKDEFMVFLIDEEADELVYVEDEETIDGVSLVFEEFLNEDEE